VKLNRQQKIIECFPIEFAGHVSFFIDCIQFEIIRKYKNIIKHISAFIPIDYAEK